jgi:hypothetical protein
MHFQLEEHESSFYFLPSLSWHRMECECGEPAGQLVQFSWLAWSLQLFYGGGHDHQ